ncbi:aminotransferase class V-fold PLP-dependent enzyme [Microbacterium sp. Bi121]|uniref:aminotransferase class V-fold PLP-dependent enzyme n=1 Tax=Microbacterium sp. Bi121 TaxID=2822348 RepID=UPI001D1CF664|nr:aminotransferase class V-fold PLP-dependent enzyme [Microbacterium sp. Bi121]CAH0128719.1 Kynureninase [Microbacterium sp. Bi121]
MSTFDDYLATFDGDPGYLDWAAFGPISPTVRAEVFADADLLGSGRPSSRSLVAERLDEARVLAAELLGVDSETVTLQPSSSHGLMHALFGLSGTVIASTAEFPSVTMTLERAAQLSAGGLVPRWIMPEDGFVTVDAVAEALDDDVTALVVSHVDFRTGYRTDLAGLRDVLGPDRLLIVDAVQSFGVVDDDYAAADVVVGHGYKWLRAARGTGFASFSAQARERIEPVLSGLAGVDGGLPIDELPAPAASARAFIVNGPDQLAVARLAIGLRDVRDAGVAEIEETIRGRIDTIFEIADRHGIPVLTPRDRERRAGIVTLAPEAPAAVSAALTNEGIVATTRGTTVRVAAHAGTSDDTLRMLDDALRTIVAPGV